MPRVRRMCSSAAATRPARCREVLRAVALALMVASAALGADDAAGRFRSAGDGLPRRGQWRDHFAIADVDGDGHPDVVHGPARKASGGPVVFRRANDERWQPWDALRVPALGYAYGGVATGDFTGDGVADVVLAGHLRGLVALRGARDGTFVAASRGLEA